MSLHLSNNLLYSQSLSNLPNKKLLISTLNAYSFNIAQSDTIFQMALQQSDVLLPDGISVVFATRLLTGQRLKKIAGEDLFLYEMNKLNSQPHNPVKGELRSNKVFFLGSNEVVLAKIKARAAIEFPFVEVHTYSPPYKSEFSEEENKVLLDVINAVKPDILFVGMTAPKQEKWAYQHFTELQAGHVCCIGAVFDFYAGTIQRAPQWMINIGLEWFYRLIKEPGRMWKRYLIGNVKFVWYVLREKFSNA